MTVRPYQMNLTTKDSERRKLCTSYTCSKVKATQWMRSLTSKLKPFPHWDFRNSWMSILRLRNNLVKARGKTLNYLASGVKTLLNFWLLDRSLWRRDLAVCLSYSWRGYLSMRVVQMKMREKMKLNSRLWQVLTQLTIKNHWSI